ncbi:MAG TPA: SMI1/KNR4 family protein [Chloroflexota bacterium]|nr:SMI1/KNR4 family protein [Chloroflexota bacterium]
MDIESLLAEITKINYLAVPRKHTISKQIETTAVKTADTWLVPCSHILYSPITQRQAAELNHGLNKELPKELQDLLAVTNGADLFRIKYESPQLGDYWIARYKILNHSELLQVNLELLDTFLSYAELDADYRGESLTLNYLAFCDVGDGNYLAIVTESASQGQIFYLDHDYAYYPFGTHYTRGVYFPVAYSLTEWLEILSLTNGSASIGKLFIPL